MAVESRVVGENKKGVSSSVCENRAVKVRRTTER